jgi:hypothetical protein
MNLDEIVKNCMSMIDGFDGGDDEYLAMLNEIIDECEVRIEGKEMEMEDF